MSPRFDLDAAGEALDPPDIDEMIRTCSDFELVALAELFASYRRTPHIQSAGLFGAIWSHLRAEAVRRQLRVAQDAATCSAIEAAEAAPVEPGDTTGIPPWSQVSGP